ncbi:MAG: HlyD family efflux transporter periplasmic adaptor subunit [Planctomycetota bacterium]
MTAESSTQPGKQPKAETPAPPVQQPLTSQATAANTGIEQGQEPSNDRAQSRNQELRDFLAALIRFQCRLLQSDTGAIYLVESGARAGGIAAAMQGNAPALDEPLTKRIAAIASRATEDAGRPIAEPIELNSTGQLYGSAPAHTALAVPLRADGAVEGAAVVVIPSTHRDPDDALARLGLTAARFEAHLWRRSALAEAEQKVILRETLVMLDRAQQGTDAQAMASLMAEELRRRFNATRVSIGMIRADRVRVIAVSGSDSLDPHAPAVEALEAAMEECALQDTEVIYPAPPEAEAEPASRRVIHEHTRLSEAFGPSSIVSIPLRVDGGLVGVVLLERDQTDPFPAASLPLVRLIAEFVGPAVYTRRLADRRTLQVLRDDAHDLGAAIVGPRHTAKKLVALIIAAAIIIAAVVPIPARIVAPVEIRAAQSRAVVPPFAGFLETAHVRPGDRVQQGDLLVEMSTAELDLRLAEIDATLDTLLARRDDALARNQRSDARAVQAEIDEATITAQLIRDSLADAQIRAPISGVVSLGDLERLEGAPVDGSKILLEIVGDETLAIIEIAEADADRMRPDQTGWITARGNTADRIPVSVTRINPVAQLREGRSVYLVEAAIESPGDADALRPGMTGSARLRAGWSTTLYELARPVVEAVRLRLWW